MTQVNLSMKQKQNHRQKTDLWLPRERGAGEGWSGRLWLADVRLLYIEWINNKVLQYSTANYIQNPMINHNGKEYLKKNLYIYIYIYISHI